MMTPAVLAGSLSHTGNRCRPGLDLWYIFLAPVAFAVFIIAALAELEKPPFDIPSAKTEIVGGWMTEFSGNTLAYVKLTKNLSYVFLSALAVSLFLGGPAGPVLSANQNLQVRLLHLLLPGEALRGWLPHLRHKDRPGAGSESTKRRGSSGPSSLLSASLQLAVAILMVLR